MQGCTGVKCRDGVQGCRMSWLQEVVPEEEEGEAPGAAWVEAGRRGSNFGARSTLLFVEDFPPFCFFWRLMFMI